MSKQSSNDNLHFVNDLLDTENKQLRKLNSIVAESIKEQELITSSIAENQPETITQGQKLADKVAEFGGSWKFIIIFGCVILVWVSLNTFVLIAKPFDSYPFILLNLVLSCIAALQAPVIMMSQNRKEEKDRKRAENDYWVNLKAEIEIRNLHKKVDLLMMDQIKTLIDIQKVQLELLNKLMEERKK
ncbi:MAG: DUF1003 domain-containing protein [Bacteroidetes bacterium]|nr:DUF1003 domain-containing protein [Bacteroidota bacterium]